MWYVFSMHLWYSDNCHGPSKYPIHLSQLKVLMQPSLCDAATHIVAAPCCNPSLSPCLCHRAWPEQELGALRCFWPQTSSLLVLFNIAGVGGEKCIISNLKCLRLEWSSSILSSKHLPTNIQRNKFKYQEVAKQHRKLGKVSWEKNCCSFGFC